MRIYFQTSKYVCICDIGNIKQNTNKQILRNPINF